MLKDRVSFTFSRFIPKCTLVSFSPFIIAGILERFILTPATLTPSILIILSPGKMPARAAGVPLIVWFITTVSLYKLYATPMPTKLPSMPSFISSTSDFGMYIECGSSSFNALFMASSVNLSMSTESTYMPFTLCSSVQYLYINFSTCLSNLVFCAANAIPNS